MRHHEDPDPDFVYGLVFVIAGVLAASVTALFVLDVFFDVHF